MVIQVNGKVRAKENMDIKATKDEMREAALSNENVKKFTADKKLVNVVVIPGKLVNIVVK